jgi:hypothetical protein
MRGTLVVVIVLFGLLAVAAVGAYASWQQLGDVEIGFHGWVALGLGVGLTLALGVGLMSLVFYSSRHGYDDEAGHD